jgi:hypothetical protein
VQWLSEGPWWESPEDNGMKAMNSPETMKPFWCRFEFWQGVGTISAGVIALGSALFTGMQWHDGREQFLLATRPHVDFDVDSDPDEPTTRAPHAERRDQRHRGDRLIDDQRDRGMTSEGTAKTDPGDEPNQGPASPHQERQRTLVQERLCLAMS